MAYPVVTAVCREHRHAECPDVEPGVEARVAAGYAGGWFCVCFCHNNTFNWKWYEEVREACERQGWNETPGNLSRLLHLLRSARESITAWAHEQPHEEVVEALTSVLQRGLLRDQYIAMSVLQELGVPVRRMEDGSGWWVGEEEPSGQGS